MDKKEDDFNQHSLPKKNLSDLEEKTNRSYKIKKIITIVLTVELALLAIGLGIKALFFHEESQPSTALLQKPQDLGSFIPNLEKNDEPKPVQELIWKKNPPIRNEKLLDHEDNTPLTKSNRTKIDVSQGELINFDASSLSSQEASRNSQELSSQKEPLWNKIWDETAYAVQNMQKKKEDFLHQNSEEESLVGIHWRRPESLERTLRPGTIIPILLKNGINSDLPGPVSAIVTEDVYDSFLNKNILIPANSVVTGHYNSNVSYGQRRIQIRWEILSREQDAILLNLRGISYAVDPSGLSGLEGKVEDQTINIIQALGLKKETMSTLLKNERLAWLESILSKELNRQPVITVAPGTKAGIILVKQITLPLLGEIN